MKIKTYDTGGMVVYTPFIPNRGGSQQQAQTTSPKTESKEDDSWQLKKFAEMIQNNGLISDVNVTMDNLKEIYNYAKSLSDNYLFGGEDTFDIMTYMFDAQKQINANKLRKDNWEKAQQNIVSQNA